MYGTKCKGLKKNREKLNEEITTIEKYLRLAKTLYRMEVDKAKLASLSSQILRDQTGNAPMPVTDLTDQL